MRKLLLALAAIALFGPVWAQASELRWGAVLVAGSTQEGVFANAVRDLRATLIGRLGVAAEDVAILSPDEARPSAIEDALAARVAAGAEGCLLFVTSHGEKQGLMLSPFEIELLPQRLDAALDRTCKRRPTVLILSGCYSGVYAAPPLESPNRIILTASRPDRVSFGCSNDRTHTVFDAIFLEELAKSSPADLWTDLATRIRGAVAAREEKEGFAPPSEPQFRAGKSAGGFTLRMSAPQS